VRCPFCHQDDDRVIDSRSTDDDTAIRRRRECKACGQRFTTYERVENEEQIRVIKRDGSRQSFDRRKLMAGLTVACEKRPVSASDLEALVNRLPSGQSTRNTSLRNWSDGYGKIT
jgi:transcriptional repressor NrdR